MDMPKKLDSLLAKNHKGCSREAEVTKKAAQILNLEPECKDIKFVHEYLFSVTKSAGKEIEFLETWDMLAKYFEQNAVYEGEGHAIGLAAYKAGLPVRWSQMPGISFFNKKIELHKIKKGQSNMNEMLTYFKEYERIMHPPGYIAGQKVFKRIKTIMNFYRSFFIEG